MFKVHSSSKFSGFLPVRKPKNVCCNKLLWSLREEFNFANQASESRQQVFSDISYARYLESFASGLITFIFGSNNNYRRNFVFSEYKYRFTIEFGVEREFGCIDGKLISKQDTSHINRELIEDSLKNFVGLKTQIRLNNYPTTDLSTPTLPLSQSESIFKSMQHVRDKPLPPPSKQKYQKLEIAKDVECYYIKLLDCDRYFATMELSCQGAFVPRRFTMDFADFLKTKICLVEMERLQEGPMCLDDLRVLESYQMQYDVYKKKVSSLRGDYVRYLEQFDHHFLKDN